MRALASVAASCSSLLHLRVQRVHRGPVEPDRADATVDLEPDELAHADPLPLAWSGPYRPRLSRMADVDVVVLGGGPAGLAAAWRAAGAGRSVLLLERAPAVGGMAASFEVAGVRVDTGSHRLHPATPPPVLADLRASCSATTCRPGRATGGCRSAGRWVGFPLRPAELARALPPRMLAGLARSTP